MTLDVAFSPLGLAPADVAGRTVFVVDILRATTTMCAALHRGARAIIPVASGEEAVRLAQTLGSDDVLLAGEKNCERISGFALGNSPLEMTEETVRGKTLVMATTNGTKALLATQGAAAVYVAAAANLSAAGAAARAAIERKENVLILCAGREQAFAIEDAFAAGQLAFQALGGRYRRRGLNDAALAALDLVRRYRGRWDRPLTASRAGRELARLGYKDDIAAAAQVDAHPVLVQFHDRRVTLVPAAA
jgi:2-phosphosulfolactate phosphatase